MASNQSNETKGLALKKISYAPNSPTIVFLHDSLGCIELWRDFPEKLSSLTKCNVLIYDRQGYGQSKAFSSPRRTNNYLEIEAAILARLLRENSCQNAILFGHSDGGSIALIAAAQYPELISGIITEGAHIFVEDITIKGIKDAEKLYRETNLKSRLQKYHGSKTEAMFWAWASTWTTPEFRNWNIEHFLPKISCPALIIQGADDEYGTIEQVQRIHQQVSGTTRTHIIPNIKHTPHKEAPEIVLQLVTTFIHQYLFPSKK
ncbi:alpha/beta fold hydrolase [Aquimarina hainanensis]|uniref:Alpha/beta fold hydrolase n=1 Tax=Aquimarina hainanensis TaxID=1578017 RepID=A0ABW5N4J0_9FLAO